MKLFNLKKSLTALFLLLALLLSSCGAAKKEKDNQPDAPKDSVSDEQPASVSSVIFQLEDKTLTPKNEVELSSALSEMVSLCLPGDQIRIHVECGEDQTVREHFEESMMYYISAAEEDPEAIGGVGYVNYDEISAVTAEFIQTLSGIMGVEKIEVSIYFPDEPFPVCEVGYYEGDTWIPLKSRRDLTKAMISMEKLCDGGKAYDGVGVRLVGFAVEKGDLTGIPYCHLSHLNGAKATTVLGFRHDVLPELDAKLIVDMIMICPYFERVEFYLTENAENPVR